MLELIAELLFELPFYFFSKKRRRKKKVQKLSFTPIAKAKNGQLLKVTGTAKFYKQSYTHPITQESCFCFQIAIGRWQPDSLNAVHEEEKSIPFKVEDGTADYCLVNPQHVEFLLSTQLSTFGSLSKLTPPYANYLTKNKISLKSFGIRKSFDIKEGIIIPDSKVTIIGKGKWSSEKETGKRVFLMSGSKKSPLVISNMKDMLEQ